MPVLSLVFENKKTLYIVNSEQFENPSNGYKNQTLITNEIQLQEFKLSCLNRTNKAVIVISPHTNLQLHFIRHYVSLELLLELNQNGKS